jgi:hypothetical protein
VDDTPNLVDADHRQEPRADADHQTGMKQMAVLTAWAIIAIVLAGIAMTLTSYLLQSIHLPAL